MKTSDEKKRNIETVVSAVKERYDALFKSKLFGIAISDADEKIYCINDKFLEIIGYSRAEFDEGKISWSSITPQRYDYRDQQKISEMMSKRVATAFDKEYIHKNGHAVPVAVGAELVSRNPQVNVSFVIDITERKKREKQKEEIIATIGHEIKTPLSVLRIQAALLISEIESGISLKDLIAQIKEFDEHIEQIDTILSEILTPDESRSKVFASSSRTFDLSEVVKKVVGDFGLITDRAVVVDRADPDCFIAGNEVEMKGVITNLISNALKYSPQGTRVIVSVIKKQTTIHLSVEDKGRGIAKEDQKKIFQKSYQVRHKDVRLENTSKGIGLYLTKQIVMRHGGKIEVRSVLKKGSTFTCVFKISNDYL